MVFSSQATLRTEVQENPPLRIINTAEKNQAQRENAGKNK